MSSKGHICNELIFLTLVDQEWPLFCPPLQLSSQRLQKGDCGGPQTWQLWVVYLNRGPTKFWLTAWSKCMARLQRFSQPLQSQVIDVSWNMQLLLPLLWNFVFVASGIFLSVKNAHFWFNSKTLQEIRNWLFYRYPNGLTVKNGRPIYGFASEPALWLSIISKHCQVHEC